MRPILFSKDATTFNTNGLGRLECISCKVTEERNGMYELEATIPVGGEHSDQLEMNSIIVVKPNQSSNIQAFRVYKITKPLNGKFQVFAQHISYQLSYIPVMPFTVLADSTACANTLAALKTNSAEDNPFTFWTDVTTVASYVQSVPASIRQRLGGVEGSVLDCFGGELEWDNYTVKLHQNRGIQTPQVTLRYGKNITDINQEEYISNTITGVCPYWMDSEGQTVVTLTEKVVESQYASSYPFKRTVPLDLSTEFETAPTENELRAKAESYLTSDGIGVPTVSIQVSFIDLADTEEYKDIAALQSVNLCDKVSVQFEKLGISSTAKVVKTVYDVLAERYDSIEIGSVKSSLAQTITDTNGAIEITLDKALFATKNATQWLTGSNGYVMAVKNDDGSWKELLFMDTNDAETAVNVLRINENGIGFSRNGVGGPYTQAWTMDGKLVIGGTNVPSFSVMNENTKVFELNKDALTWFYRTTGKRAVEMRDASLDIYSWETDNWEHRVGRLESVSWGYPGYVSKRLTLLADASNDDSSNHTGVELTIYDGTHFHRVLGMDSKGVDDGSTPYIANTSSGTLFSHISNGGVVVENGLVKEWSMPSYSDDLFPNAGGGIHVKDGLITGWNLSTVTSDVVVGGRTMQFKNGLLTGVS